MTNILRHEAEEAARQLNAITVRVGAVQLGDEPGISIADLASLILRLAGALPEWRPIDEAPKDGTRILIWFVHPNAKYAKHAVAEGWAAAHEAQWIDHNAGGWTWHGVAGVATRWMPLPSPPTPEEDKA